MNSIFTALARSPEYSALAKALALRKPAVIDCTLDIDEMVRPMVAAGAEITDFLLSEGGD